jgi:HSP20 family molecular chaperone IbpA
MSRLSALSSTTRMRAACELALDAVIDGSTRASEFTPDPAGVNSVKTLASQARWRPDAEVCGTPKAFEIAVDLAGVDEDDFEVRETRSRR